MNAANRKRVRDVQRAAKRRSRQVYMRRRIGLAVFAVGIIVLIIVGIRSCGNDKKTNGPVVTVIPAVTTQPDYSVAGVVGNVTEADINQEFFKDSCFVGNSVIESMEIYELLNDTDYFARVGLNVSDAMELSTTNGNVPVIDELNNEKQYKKIFMMFGENELNWSNTDKFKSDYAMLIKKAKQYQPLAQIYVLSVTPISKTADEEQTEGVSKSAVVAFNKLLKDIADKNGAIYVDLFTALADGDGFLPEGVATDGIHFNKDYYIKSIVGIQNTAGNNR